MFKKLTILSFIALIFLSGCNQVTQVSADGRHKYVGTVNSDGIREGTGKFYTDDVLVYEGEYSNDLPHGEGREYHTETGIIMFIGEFRDGLFYKGTMYDEDGVKMGPYSVE